MQLAAPVIMNEYPAEYIVLGEGDLWAMDAGSDTLFYRGNQLLNRVFLPAVQHLPMVLANSRYYRGLFSGNITDKAYDTYDPFPLSIGQNDHISPDDMAWEQIVWHPSGRSFTGVLSPLKPRDGRNRRSLTHEYPVVHVDAQSGKTTVLKQGSAPVDAIQLSSSYILVCREACVVYDSGFQQLGSRKKEDTIQTDTLVIFDQEDTCAMIGAQGQIAFCRLPGLQPIASAVIENYGTKQPLVITADNHLVTGNSNGELFCYHFNGTALLPVANKTFNGMITALAAHPTEKRLALALAGNEEGTFWLSWD